VLLPPLCSSLGRCCGEQLRHLLFGVFLLPAWARLGDPFPVPAGPPRRFFFPVFLWVVSGLFDAGRSQGPAPALFPSPRFVPLIRLFFARGTQRQPNRRERRAPPVDRLYAAAGRQLPRERFIAAPSFPTRGFSCHVIVFQAIRPPPHVQCPQLPLND